MYADLRCPLVTTADREWALMQVPVWARRASREDGADGVVDDGRWLEDTKPNARPYEPRPCWDQFVSEQVESFERYFAFERKTFGDWSRLWRHSWWPKANPTKRFPMSAPKTPQPFFRKGTAEFVRALDVATTAERAMWQRFGVAQFKPDDPRLLRVRRTVAHKIDRKMAVAGERE